MAPTISSRAKVDDDKRTSRTAEKRTDLICRVKYTNTLPDIPFDPKFIQYPFDPLRFVTYKETSLEKMYKWELHTEHDLGVTIDLVDPDTYAIPINSHLEQVDEKILEEESTLAPTESKRSKLHSMAASWLRKTEYMSAENFRTGQTSDKSESRIGYRIRKQMDDSQMYKDRDAQIATITKTFEVAKETITSHYSKPGVKPVEVLPVFPDFQMWGLPCAQVIFDSDPAPAQTKSQTELEEEMCEAIIRGMMDDTGEQFVAYFLPTDDTKVKRKTDTEAGVAYDPALEYDYRLAREYNWTVKHKGTRGYEQSYFFLIRPDGVYYNELETRVRLSRRKMDVGKKAAASNTKLILKHRPFNEQEMHMQEGRMSHLEPLMEVEEEEEDEEEDEDGGDGEDKEQKGEESGEESSKEVEESAEKENKANAAESSDEDDRGDDKKTHPSEEDKSLEKEHGRDSGSSVHEESDSEHVKTKPAGNVGSVSDSDDEG